MVLNEDTTTDYNCFVEKRELGCFVKTNNTGGALTQRDLVMIEGVFGIVKYDAAIDEDVTIEFGPDIEIQSSQLKELDTFALSGDEAPAWVYWDNANSELSDTATPGYYRVGLLTKALGTDTYIKFIPVGFPEVVA